MLSFTLNMFWTTVTSQTFSEEEWMNSDTVKPTVTFGSRAGFKKGTLTLPCFHTTALTVVGASSVSVHDQRDKA